MYCLLTESSSADGEDNMADYTAIYEAGESIVNMLRNIMVPEPIAKKEHIGLCEPQSPEDFQLTVWIYNIEMVKDTGTRTGFQPDPENPALERFSPMQLRLQMLISAHSKAPAIQRFADEYRIIGRALQALRDVASIPQEYLVGSLADVTEPVLIEIKKLESEELTRIWNNSTKTMKPSFGITVSQVFVRSERTREAAPRVAVAEFSTVPKKGPARK